MHDSVKLPEGNPYRNILPEQIPSRPVQNISDAGQDVGVREGHSSVAQKIDEGIITAFPPVLDHFIMDKVTEAHHTQTALLHVCRVTFGLGLPVMLCFCCCCLVVLLVFLLG